MKTFKLVTAYEMRDLAQAAAQNARGTVKVKFPFPSGGLIHIEYNEIDDLVRFAMEWGVLMWQLNPEEKITLRKQVDCTFFCCANCRMLGKENRHKVFINLCNKCGIDQTEIQNARTTEFWKAFDLRNAPKIKEEPEPQPEIKPPEIIKPEVKKVSPVKLKFSYDKKDTKEKDNLKIKTPKK